MIWTNRKLVEISKVLIENGKEGEGEKVLEELLDKMLEVVKSISDDWRKSRALSKYQKC